MVSFISKTSPNIVVRPILALKEELRNLKFLTKTMDESLWKDANFAVSFNQVFIL